jgi:2-oxoglutarate ferredoxin oxidoreductase subunit beta
LRKLREDYDATDKMAALSLLHEGQEKRELLTGLIYVEPEKRDFLSLLHLPEEPLATYPDVKTRPDRDALEQMMEELK